MKIVAVDTSTSSCSVALVEDGRLLAEYIYVDGRTHSVNLVMMIERLFDHFNLTESDLHGFAVSVGPGTFTGLRIGVSVVKGLACGMDKPVVGINSLDALAFPIRQFHCSVVSMIDAKRGEIYYACYITSSNGELKRNTVYNVSSPKQVLLRIPYDAMLIGSGVEAYSDVFHSYMKPSMIENDTCNLIRASSVGFLAAKRFIRGDTDCVETLVPYYIRESDAQIHTIKSKGFKNTT